MKNIKRTILFLISTMFFFSCNNSKKATFLSMNMKNKQVGKSIVKYLNSKDCDGIYSLFSEKTKKEIPTLKADIDKFFLNYDCIISSYENIRDGTIATLTFEKTIYSYDNRYECIINDVKYSLCFTNTVKNSVAPEEEGVTGIKLIREDDRDEYIKGVSYGIFIPSDDNYYKQ